MKYIPIFCLLLVSSVGVSQSLVKDNTNNGQMKRMVFKKWDDWSGYNKLVALIYWSIIHRSYKRGGDKRPYRLDGPFAQNYASLSLQANTDGQIMDLTNEAYKTHVATYENMSGGALDLPYSLYFEKKFNELFSQATDIVATINTHNSLAYSYLQNNLSYKDYLEFLEIEKDRISNIHQSFVDKGERIKAYLDIKAELQKRNAAILPIIYNILHFSKIPTTTTVSQIQKSSNPPVFNTDKAIIKDILQHYKF
jgi:hypothetical protein